MIAALTLYFFAVGGVRGFAFTLGLTTLIDLIVVFLFTKPLVTVLAKFPFLTRGIHSLVFQVSHWELCKKQATATGGVSNG